MVLLHCLPVYAMQMCLSQHRACVPSRHYSASAACPNCLAQRRQTEANHSDFWPSDSRKLRVCDYGVDLTSPYLVKKVSDKLHFGEKQNSKTVETTHALT